MGLDTVELVMRFEDEFDITIPDADAEKLQTLGETLDYVLLRLEDRPRRGVCLSAHAFYQIRRELLPFTPLGRKAIRPGTTIGSILPDRTSRRQWVAIAQRCDLPVPPFDIRHPLMPRFPKDETTLRRLVKSRRWPKRVSYRDEIGRDAVWEAILGIVSHQTGVDRKELHKDTHYINDLN
ncbi:MAG TPA: acyl carrier protein [Humisphaera sp.]|jgi:hypothetical protein|nr:acyl carrier protein [Humisphaera sp.]